MGQPTGSFSYSGFAIPDATVRFAQKTEWDSTGRVLMGYTCTLEADGFINQTTTLSLQAQINSLEQSFAQPRQRFTWSFGGIPIWDVAPPGGGALLNDLRWGPKARVISCKQITGGVSARVSVAVEFFVAECPNGPGNVQEAWSQESIGTNQNWQTTRTINGQYRLVSPLNAASTFLTTGTFYPPVPSGFIVESSHSGLSSDGTVVSWTVTQRSEYRTYPAPMTSGDCQFSVEQRGSVITSRISGHLECPDDVNKNVMIQFLQALLRARMPGLYTTPRVQWPRHVSISTSEFKNTLDFSVVCDTTAMYARKDTNGTYSFPTVTPVGWGDIVNAVPLAGDSWTASNGSAATRSMVGTGGIVPGVQSVFSVCSTNLTPFQNYGAYSTNAIQQTPGTQTGGTSGGSSPQGTYDTSTMSVTQTNNAIVSFSDLWSFHLNRNLTMIPVASTSGASAIIQQTAPGQMRVIQVACIRQLDAMPAAPNPPGIFTYASGGTTTAATLAYINNESRDPENPDFLADGQSVIYGLRVRREILAPNITAFPSSGGLSGTNQVEVLTSPSPIFSDSQNAATQTVAASGTVGIGLDGSYASAKYS